MQPRLDNVKTEVKTVHSSYDSLESRVEQLLADYDNYVRLPLLSGSMDRRLTQLAGRYSLAALRDLERRGNAGRTDRCPTGARKGRVAGQLDADRQQPATLGLRVSSHEHSFSLTDLGSLMAAYLVVQIRLAHRRKWWGVIPKLKVTVYACRARLSLAA